MKPVQRRVSNRRSPVPPPRTEALPLPDVTIETSGPSRIKVGEREGQTITQVETVKPAWPRNPLVDIPAPVVHSDTGPKTGPSNRNSKEKFMDAQAQSEKELQERKVAEKNRKLEEKQKAEKERAEAKAKKEAERAEAKAKKEAEAKAKKEAAEKARAERAARLASVNVGENASDATRSMIGLRERASAGAYKKMANGQLAIGDEVAEILGVLEPKNVVEAIRLTFGATGHGEGNKYAHLNIGQQSMNFRNRLRGLVKKDATILEVLRQKVASLPKIEPKAPKPVKAEAKPETETPKPDPQIPSVPVEKLDAEARAVAAHKHEHVGHKHHPHHG